MLVECIKYYSGVLFWIRSIHLKRANYLTLTDNEVRMLSLFEETSPNILKPMYMYLRAFGALTKIGTGQTLIPNFLTLPEQQVNSFSDYWRPLVDDNHNSYDEYPSLEVLSKGIR